MGIKSKIIRWFDDSAYFIYALTLIFSLCRWSLHLVIQDSKEIWTCFIEIDLKNTWEAQFLNLQKRHLNPEQIMLKIRRTIINAFRDETDCNLVIMESKKVA